MVRGIEKRDIFLDDSDRSFFVRRLSHLLQETGTQCLAWCLIPNHFHLLVKPTSGKLSSLMRRLLTSYAVTFNHRHGRSGHLFQNRYKSIICEEDPYLLELVRYIHLNPLRAGLVADMDALDRYPWTGHSAIMGTQEMVGQDVEEVLACFGRRVRAARASYRRFLLDGAGQGARDELVGGGLQRILKAGIDERPSTSDERILGRGEFVQRLLGEREENPPRPPTIPLPFLVARVAEIIGLTPEEIRASGRSKQVAAARSVISYLGYRTMGYSGEAVARELGISRSGVCRRADFGEKLVREDERLQSLLEN